MGKFLIALQSSSCVNLIGHKIPRNFKTEYLSIYSINWGLYTQNSEAQRERSRGDTTELLLARPSAPPLLLSTSEKNAASSCTTPLRVFSSHVLRRQQRPRSHIGHLTLYIINRSAKS